MRKIAFTQTVIFAISLGVFILTGYRWLDAMLILCFMEFGGLVGARFGDRWQRKIEQSSSVPPLVRR